MSDNSTSGVFGTCSMVCWLLSFVAGLFVANVFIYWLGLHGMVGAVVGLIVMLALGVVLKSAVCPEMEERAVAPAGADADDTGAIMGETVSVPAEPVDTSADSFAPEAEAAPEMYDSAPEAPDDLKVISGVGPALEKTLNELGIYKYEQIASWTAADIAWVDARLTFKGRIERDDWVKQARELAGNKG